MPKEKVFASTRAFKFEPSSINDEERTVEVTYNSGEGRVLGGFFTEPFWEELSSKKGDVNLGRLDSGNAPVLNSHNRWDLNDVIGHVVEANEKKATLRFSKDPSVDSIWTKIKEGVLRNVSVGYKIHKMVESGKKKLANGKEIVRKIATDWEPLEISVVPIPADSRANIRTMKDTEDSEVLREVSFSDSIETKGEGEDMPKEKKTELEESKKEEQKNLEEENKKADNIEAAEKKEPQENLDVEEKGEPEMPQEQIKEAKVQERARVNSILAVCKAMKADDETQKRFLDSDMTVEQVKSELLDAVVEKQEGERLSNTTVDKDASQKEREACESAIEKRGFGEALEEGNPFNDASVYDMVKHFAKKSGFETKGADKTTIIQRGLHSSSDFPNLTGNVLNRSLRRGYDEMPKTFVPWTAKETVNDLRDVHLLNLGVASNLDETPEGAAATYGTIGESKEVYKLLEYTKIIGVTQKVILNDDLRAFTKVPKALGQSAARKESDIVYEQLTTGALGATMGADNKALFHADHSNTTDALYTTVDGLATLFALIENQTADDGESALNLLSRFLIVNPTNRVKALKLAGQINSTKADDNNPLAGTFQVISEPRIKGTEVNYGYAIADPALIDTLVTAYLAGQERPKVISREGFEISGIEYKIQHFFAAKLADHRGFARTTNNAS